MYVFGSNTVTIDQQKKSYNLSDALTYAFERRFESEMPILGDFDNKVKRSGQLEERLSDIELGHKTEKVKTMKMMERTVEFFLEIMKKKLRMRKMKI